MKIIAIRPGFEFEHEGVNVKAVKSKEHWECKGCVFVNDIYENCKKRPCYPSDKFPKQEHDLIFIQTNKQNEDNS